MKMKNFLIALLVLILFTASASAVKILNEVKSTQTLAAAGQIDCTGGRIGGGTIVTAPVASDGGAVDLTSNPQILTTGHTAGDICYILGTSDTNTLEIDTGTGVVVDASIVFDADRLAQFTYDGTNWVHSGVAEGGSVDSVFTRTGAVTAASGDYTADEVTNVAAGDIVATELQAAIDELDGEKLPLAGGTLTGLLTTDNLGIEFTESDTNPTCASGNYNIFGDLSETSIKLCNDGTAAVIATADNTLTLTNKTLAAANNVIDADSAILLASNPADCSANEFADAIAANGDLTCNAIADADVPDTITVSDYCKLSGGVDCTMTGELIADNLGVEFIESDTNPTCAAGDYILYADLSETVLKKCEDGVVSVMDTGGGSGDITTVGTCTTGDCAIEGGNDMFPFIYEGTANTEETTFSVTDPTADRAVVFPDVGGEVSLLGQSISDAEVDDDITASSYLPLAGGTMTGDLTTEKLIFGQHGFEVVDSGDGNPATATLNPTHTYVVCACLDNDSCDITMGETGAVNGQLLVITTSTGGAATCDFVDTSGVSELAGAVSLGVYDTLTLLYKAERWIEVSRSNN